MMSFYLLQVRAIWLLELWGRPVGTLEKTVFNDREPVMGSSASPP